MFSLSSFFPSSYPFLVIILSLEFLFYCFSYTCLFSFFVFFCHLFYIQLHSFQFLAYYFLSSFSFHYRHGFLSFFLFPRSLLFQFLFSPILCLTVSLFFLSSYVHLFPFLDRAGNGDQEKRVWEGEGWRTFGDSGGKSCVQDHKKRG